MALQLSARGQEVVPASYLAHPMKIGCGSSHSLFLATRMDDNEQADETDRFVLTTVMGFGSNRHNPLGLRPYMSSEAFEASHGDVGNAPWKASVVTPSESVLCDNDPVQHRNIRRQHSHFGKGYAIEEEKDLSSARKKKDEKYIKDFNEAFEVSCGNNHSMVLEKRHRQDNDNALTESRLWSFGMQGNGRCGRDKPKHFKKVDEDEDTDLESEATYPEEVFEDGKFIAPGIDPTNKPVVQRVCCGADHTLAIVNFMGKSGQHITHSGRLFAWGLGSYGALGTKRKEDSWVPKEIWLPGESEEDNQRSVMVGQAACGSKHSMALSSDGKVFTWGHAGNGRLGLGRKTTRLGDSFSAQFEPQLVERLADTKIMFLAAGESHSGCCDQLGGVYMWGEGSFGRCGLGMNMDSIYPARVETLLGTAIGQISMGMAHTLAVTVKGQLYSWGKGPATGLDKGDNEHVDTPQAVNLEGGYNNPVYQISCGHLHSMVLMHDGNIFTFGSGSDYRLPRFGRDPGKNDVGCPQKMDPLGKDTKGWSKAMVEKALESSKGKGATKREKDKHPKIPAQMAAGGSNSAVVLHNGELWIWGSHVLASKADAPPENRDEDAPKNVDTSSKDIDIWVPSLLRKGFRALTIRTISIGYSHALALTHEAMLFAWGKGDAGQLGTGNLGTFDDPQLITNVSEVVWCSAGEEHSACIIEGGESYTWGKASGGRLGLSATMNEGVQMLPEQVVINMTGTKDLRLKSLSCGSEHTTFISEDGRVLSCGVGWFGRLGQGGQDNSYSPAFATSKSLRASESHSAAYHTCIVDESRRLWITGRDTACCKPPGKHVLTPELFQPFESPTRKYIYALSCSDAHTLVLTSKSPNAPHGTELWGWGKNSKGQLGISEVQAPRIDLPWQIRLPGEGVDWHKFTSVATSAWHSMVTVEGKGRAAHHFEIYSWGFMGSGRLGLKITETDGNSTEIVVADGHKGVRPPGVVDIRWRPRDQGISHVAITEEDDSPSRSFFDLLQTPSRSWYDVQQKLHQEDPENKVAKLEEKGESVGKQYSDYMKDVLSLWDKPPLDSDKKTEYHIRRKKMEVESQYIRTLSVLSFKNSVHAPKIDTLGKTQQEIRAKLYLFEELFWILQQQPLYLMRLSGHIGNKKRDEMEPIVFHRVIRQLFTDFTMSRSRTLFKALVRAIVRKEMQRAISAEELFNPISSRSVPLFRQMVTNPYYMHSLARKVLDPEDRSSLMYTIIQYSLSKDGCIPRSKEAWISGIFATNVSEYEMADKYYRELRGYGKRSDEELGKGRQYFQDELKDFAKLINGLGGSIPAFDPNVHEDSMTDDELRERFANAPLINRGAWFRMRKERTLQQYDRLSGPGGQAEEDLYKRVMRLMHSADWESLLKQQLSIDAPFIKDFVSHFIKHVVGEKQKEIGAENRNVDFQMLLQHMFKQLTAQKYVIQYKSTTGNDWLPELLQCMTSIVLGSMIGGVLFAVQTGPFTMWRTRIKKYVYDLETQFIGESMPGISKESMDLARDNGLLERVWWNVERLALFFERCVHEHVYDYQVKDQKGTKGKGTDLESNQKFQEDAVAKQAAKELKEFTCKVLLSVLQPVAGGETVHLFVKDETETELTVDLYMSHYDMRRNTVSVSTSDMLNLTNILHNNMNPDSRNPENQGVAIDSEEHCRLWQVLNKILPTEKTEGQKKERTVPWSNGHISIAQEIGEMHNFTMRSRFLEFKNTGMEEPTFCRETQVPIPRSLSNKEQKKNLGIRRVVKPLRQDQGQEMDIEGQKVFPFQELMKLLEDLSGNARGENANPRVHYRLTGSSFTEMRNSFDNVQDVINKEMQNDAGNATNLASLLQRLEHAKTFVNRIRESSEEKDLRSYMDQEIIKRTEYNEYLGSLKSGMSKIQHAQENYQNRIKDTYKKLCKVNDMTETCEMPEEITGAMQMNQERAKFIDARQQKLRMRKDRSNPSRNVLDELIRNQSRDGTHMDMEAMKEMVGFPARQYKKNTLEKKGVLIQLNDLIPNNVRKQMLFSFHYEKEAYTVRVFVKTTLLREFEISREDVQMLDYGLKNSVKSYGDDFLYFNCFRLRRLLAFIQSEGGL